MKTKTQKVNTATATSKANNAQLVTATNSKGLSVADTNGKTTAKKCRVIVQTPQGKKSSISVLAPKVWTTKITCPINGKSNILLPEYMALFDEKGTLEVHRITKYNVQAMGQRIAIRAVKTIYEKTALTAEIATQPEYSNLNISKATAIQNRKNTIYTQANATTKGEKAKALRIANEKETQRKAEEKTAFDEAVANANNNEKGYFDFIHNLYINLIQDVNHVPQVDKEDTHIYSDSTDIVQECICFLLEYMGQPLDGISKVLDKKKQPVTIKKACFRHINRYIMRHRTRSYKTTALLDNGEYITPPPQWDTPTITDLKTLQTIIEKMKLSSMEKRILHLRLQGYSRDKIGQKLSLARGNVNTYCKRIENKGIKLGLTPHAKKDFLQELAQNKHITQQGTFKALDKLTKKDLRA